jgi:hypothetical protein
LCRHSWYIMGGLNNGSHDHDGCACGRGPVVLVGIAIMDPVIVIAALIIIAVEMWIRLL